MGVCWGIRIGSRVVIRIVSFWLIGTWILLLGTYSPFLFNWYADDVWAANKAAATKTQTDLIVIGTCPQGMNEDEQRCSLLILNVLMRFWRKHCAAVPVSDDEVLHQFRVPSPHENHKRTNFTVDGRTGSSSSILAVRCAPANEGGAKTRRRDYRAWRVSRLQ